MRMMNKIVMTLAGLLLIAAAILKFQEMLSICIPSWRTNPLGFWESYEFFLIQIPLEFAMGVWLVSGLFRKAAWIVGTLAYLGFIGATLTKGITGAESCGCFGKIHVDPWITLFAIDIPFFLLLAICRPKGYKLLPPWPNMFYLLAVAVPTIGLMVMAAPALVTFRPDCIKAVDARPDATGQLKLQLHKLKQELSGKQQEIGTLKQTIIEFQQAPPKPFENGSAQPEPTEIEAPVADTIDTPPVVEQWDWLEFVVEDEVRQQISEGLTLVLMYHHDCEICAEKVPAYSNYYAEMVELGNEAFKIAFLAVPPYGDEGPVPEETTCILGTLTDEQDWLVMSPYVVALLDGELVKTWEQGTAPEPDKILEEVFGP